jgi:hypothetical protein
MSPSKDFISAFAVYNSKKNQRKRKSSHGTKTGSIDDVSKTVGESGVEEILNNEDEPSTSDSCIATGEKKRKRSDTSFKVVDQPRTSGAEVVNVDEDSDDILLIENGSKSIRRKVVVLNPESAEGCEDEEVVFEDTTVRRRKSTKGMKNLRRNSVVSDDEDICIITEDDAEEDKDTGNSLVEGRKLLAWLINPVVPEDFFR